MVHAQLCTEGRHIKGHILQGDQSINHSIAGNDNIFRGGSFP